MRRTARRGPVLLMLAALAVSARGCQGTNTGSPDCAPSGWCGWPVDVSIGERTFRGTFRLDGVGIVGQANEIEESDGQCTELFGYADLQLQWATADSQSLPNGDLYVHLDDLQGPLEPAPRPLLSVDGASVGLTVQLDLVLAQDGALAATGLIAVFDPALFGVEDAGPADSGPLTVPFRIEGPITVECPRGQSAATIPVGTGDPAQVRCATVPAPVPPCDDTVESSVFRCSMR